MDVSFSLNHLLLHVALGFVVDDRMRMPRSKNFMTLKLHKQLQDTFIDWTKMRYRSTYRPGNAPLMQHGL